MKTIPRIILPWMGLMLLALAQAGCGGCGVNDGSDDDADEDGDGDGTGGDGVDGGDTATDGPRPEGSDGICADISLGLRPVTPRVIILVDQSGSMDEGFSSSGSRWEVLRDSLLLSPGGLIFELQSLVEFGLVLYSARSDDHGNPVGECPLLTSVPPALDNYAAIEGVYAAASPIDDTPTGDSIDALVAQLDASPDPDGDPGIIVLATDGEPDHCGLLDPQEGQPQAVAAAENAYAHGYRTYVISVGEGVVSAEHLQDMADAGLGLAPADPPAPYWVAGDDEGLEDALRTIIGGEASSCLIEVNGEIVMDLVCSGTVTLNGVVLPCNDPDGWDAPDSKHIELLGEACQTLLDTPDATLTATFPCDAVIMI